MERLFGERVPEAPAIPNSSTSKAGGGLLDWIRKNECGAAAEIETAFGRRRVIYADYAASARALRPIEDYLLKEVHPLYGNTHSSVTATAEQTTLFVHEARQEIRSLTGAGDDDAVIFVGSGSTAAAELLVHLMGYGSRRTRQDGGEDEAPPPPPPLVVVHSTMEHHTNLLPWREVAEECISIGETAEGRIDTAQLEKRLYEISTSSRFADHAIVGAFTAASNVTGILNDYAAINEILQRYSALSIWDFAAAAPYVDVNINGEHPADAIFFSGHKFAGGVGTPGVLVVKKALCRATRPKRTGGGTVFFVDDNATTYLRDVEYREEGGTADALGIIRLALAVKVKRSIGEEIIREREEAIVSSVLTILTSIPNLTLLGSPTRQRRLATFSFLIKDLPSGLFFHHNYISALLNDLFGIQSRAGCVCAGPYAQELLGIQGELTSRFLALLRESASLDRLHLRRVGEYSAHEAIRPGFTRISLPYWASDEQVSFILRAVGFVAEHAADFLHYYQLNAESSEWHHERARVFHDRKWLGYVDFGGGTMKVDRRSDTKHSTLPEDAFDAAEEEARRAREERRGRSTIADGRAALSAEASALRWFVLPIEVWEREERGTVVTNPQCVVQPKVYPDAPIAATAVSSGQDEKKAARVAAPSCTVVDGESPCNGEAGDAEPPACPLMDVYEAEQRGITVNDEVDGQEVEGIAEGEEEENQPSSSAPDALEDWNRRVIVRRRETTREEEAALDTLWARPPLEIYRQMTDVLHGLEMIKSGDRVLVCLSGGKDSLSMLHLLRHYQKRNRERNGIRFELGAITVDPGSTAYNPRPLIDYCRRLNIDYFYEEQDIIGQARKQKNLRSICAFCSRLKRGRLAAAAVHHGWNVLAMGQHLDDLAESFFIAAFQNGNLSTMKAQYTTRDTSLRVIRPLVLVREKALRDFAADAKLPVVAENCPACFNQATERHRIKQMLATQELLFPEMFHSLRSALRPLLLVDSATTADMRRLAIENIVKANEAAATKKGKGGKGTGGDE